jgi:hypothetical protein
MQEGNIIVYLKDMMWEGVDWINFASGHSNQLLSSMKAREFLEFAEHLLASQTLVSWI